MEEELKRLISDNKVIPFVGAGVSKAVKFKNGQDAFINWKELLESFLNDISDEDNLAVIKAMLNVKNIEYLDVADRIEKEFTTNNFNKILKDSLSVNYNHIDEDTYELAKSIWNLDSNLVITTNYDKVLHNACEDKNINDWDITSLHEQGNYARDGVNEPTVWNLHGSIGNVDNVILTTQKYNKLYTDEVLKSEYKASLQLLQTIISSKSLLFIGFSLDDAFIINQLNKIIEIFGGNNPEHYALLKEGSEVNTLDGNIKVIYYEDHGQPLIEKINSFKPISVSDVQTEEETSVQSIQNNSTRNLTTLPPKHENFIGRVEDLKTIEKMLSDESLTYIVNGIGGVGKSDLANQYFNKNMHKYNNVAFIELTEDATSLEELFLSKFKDSLHLDTDSTFDTVIQRLQNLPSKNLLLLDNLGTKEDFEKVRALNRNFDLLVTTRITDIDVKNQLDLSTLNDEDAKELFLSIYKEDENIKDILEYLDNHPLFVNLTAKSLEKGYITLGELRAEIKNDNIYKINSKDNKTFEEHLEDRFSKQFSNEPKNELKELLQILSEFPSVEIDFKILQKAISGDTLRVNLQKLVDRGWLSKKESSFKLHQIIKLFIKTNYSIKYEDMTKIFDNIGKYIDPKDSVIIASQLHEYIPIIESFLHTYETKEDEYICGILDSITYLYYSLGQYTKSLNYQEKSFQIRKKTFGDNSEYTAKSYGILGILYEDFGDYFKALKYQKKSLKIFKDIKEPNHQALAHSYSNISNVYKCINKLSEALEYQEMSIIIREKYLDSNHPDLASSYNNISLIYQDMKNYSKALEYQEISLKIVKDVLEDNHPSLAINYNNISLVYQNMNNLDKALEYQEMAIEIQEEVLELNHPDLALSYSNLSTIYQAMKSLVKALRYQSMAIKIREDVFDTNHPNLAISYHNYSSLYYDVKECQKAKKFALKSIEIFEQLDYNHPDLIHAKSNLKNIELNIKKQKKAKHKDKGRFCKNL